MARYKVLKSVAHNIGQSFTSLMNYAGDDHVMGHVLRLARQTGCDTLAIDLVAGYAEPAELLQEPISKIPARYSRMFWSLVERHGSNRSFVKAATLVLRYDLHTQRPLHRNENIIESPYTCDVRITDDRGQDYTSHLHGGIRSVSRINRSCGGGSGKNVNRRKTLGPVALLKFLS